MLCSTEQGHDRVVALDHAGKGAPTPPRSTRSTRADVDANRSDIESS